MSRRGPAYLAGAVFAIALLCAGILPDEKALLDGAKRGDVAAVKAALKAGADPNAAQGDGLTALHLAAQEGNLEITKLMLGARANVEARTRIGGYTPLHLASREAHLAVVRALLDAGADASAATTTTGVTALHVAAGAVEGEAVVSLLLDHGAAVNARERAAGQTPLMFAAAAGQAATIRALLSHGADPSLATTPIDVLRRLAIDKAAATKLRDTEMEIRKGRTDTLLTSNEEQKAIAAQRAFLRSQDQVEQALAAPPKEDPNAQGGGGGGGGGGGNRTPIMETLILRTGGLTALLHAAREGHVEAVVALLDGGADIDQVSADGSSALTLALLNGRFDMAMVLIDRGANPNLATNTDGVSPLFAVLQTQWSNLFTDHPQPRAQESQKTEYLDVLRALLDHGAEPNVRLKTHLWYWEFAQGAGSKLGLDITGATPFWRAAFARDVDAMRLLVAHGADPNTPTAWPDNAMRGGRQQDGRLQEDSGLPKMPTGTPNMYPIHAATGGGYMGIGAFMVNGVPNNFINAVKYLVEELGADVNLPDSWGYTPLHYASVRGGNDMIQYLVSKGANVKAVSRLGQSTADMARGGQGGYFTRTAYPETVKLLQDLGSPLLCLHTHFRGTGDWCEGAGVPPFEPKAGLVQ